MQILIEKAQIEQQERPYCRNSRECGTIAPAVAVLTTKSVPSNLAISPGKFYIVACQGNLQWRYPIQFSEFEVWFLLPRLDELDWSLSGSNSRFAGSAIGVPIFALEIHEAVESLLLSLPVSTQERRAA